MCVLPPLHGRHIANSLPPARCSEAFEKFSWNCYVILLKEIDRETGISVIFQKDGALCHYSLIVQEALKSRPFIIENNAMSELYNTV